MRQLVRPRRPARLHLKVDTGLGRAGAPVREWPALVERAAEAQAEGSVQVVGVWSHLAYADAPGHPTIDAQIEAFREALALAEAEGVHPEVRHLANSAATLTRPDAHFDLVRPGIAVYGISPMPDDHPSDTLGLRPAMTLTARVALVKRLPAGHGVSYLHRYRTDRRDDDGARTRSATPTGSRATPPTSGRSSRRVALRTIAGTVCMDQFVLDVGDDAVEAGDEVVLFGPGDSGEPTVDDWARASGTISYEIVTRIGPRVPRTYVGGAGVSRRSGRPVSASACSPRAPPSAGSVSGCWSAARRAASLAVTGFGTRRAEPRVLHRRRRRRAVRRDRRPCARRCDVPGHSPPSSCTATR